jgi:hypothetical protein
VYGTLFTCLAVVISSIPTYYIINWVADFLGVDMEAPSLRGVSLDSFDYLVLSIMFLNFIASLCFVIYLICLYKNWSFKRGVISLIMGKNLPSHWFDKPNDS